MTSITRHELERRRTLRYIREEALSLQKAKQDSDLTKPIAGLGDEEHPQPEFAEDENTTLEEQKNDLINDPTHTIFKKDFPEIEFTSFDTWNDEIKSTDDNFLEVEYNYFGKNFRADKEKLKNLIIKRLARDGFIVRKFMWTKNKYGFECIKLWFEPIEYDQLEEQAIEEGETEDARGAGKRLVAQTTRKNLIRLLSKVLSQTNELDETMEHVEDEALETGGMTAPIPSAVSRSRQELHNFAARVETLLYDIEANPGYFKGAADPNVKTLEEAKAKKNVVKGATAAQIVAAMKPTKADIAAVKKVLGKDFDENLFKQTKAKEKKSGKKLEEETAKKKTWKQSRERREEKQSKIGKKHTVRETVSTNLDNLMEILFEQTTISAKKPVEIKIKTDKKIKMAAVYIDGKLVMQGNYDDFYSSCHGIEKYGTFEDRWDLVEKIQKHYAKKGIPSNVIHIKGTYDTAVGDWI